MSKISKFFKKPGLFFRDYFINRYPIDYGGGVVSLNVEGGIKKNKTKKLEHLEKSIYTKKENIQIDLGYELFEPIDIVITWVDGLDPVFLKEKKLYEMQSDVRNLKQKKEISDIARYESRDELRYTLRSIAKFAPWVNKIYLVTNGQLPSWINTDTEKLIVVNHSEIIDAKYLPTFNSHVIESHLHKIQGLSELYIYFNDDVMLTRPVSPKYFYTAGGLVNVFATDSKLPKAKRSFYDTPTQWAAKNSRDLLYKDFGYFPDVMFSHTFHPQIKSVNESIEKKWADQINNCRSNRFRSETDLAMPTFLHHHFAIMTGKAIAKTTSCMYFNVRSVSSKNIYRSLLARKDTLNAPYSMCLNDTISTSGRQDFNFAFEMANFLETYFPDISEFENIGTVEA